MTRLMSRQFLTRSSRSLALLVVATPGVRAQAVYGSIGGIVTDTTGAARARCHGHHHERRAQDRRHGRDQRVRLLREGAPAARHLRGEGRARRASRPPSSRPSSVSVDTQTPVDFKLELGADRRRRSTVDRPSIAAAQDRPRRRGDDVRLASRSPSCRCSIATSPSSSCSRPARSSSAGSTPRARTRRAPTQTMVNGQTLQRHRLPARRHREPRPDPRHHRHQPEPRGHRRDQDHLAELRRGVRPGDRRRRVGADQVRQRTSSTAARSSSSRRRQLPGAQPVHAAPRRIRSPASICPRPSGTSSAARSAGRS